MGSSRLASERRPRLPRFSRSAVADARRRRGPTQVPVVTAARHDFRHGCHIGSGGSDAHVRIADLSTWPREPSNSAAGYEGGQRGHRVLPSGAGNHRCRLASGPHESRTPGLGCRKSWSDEMTTSTCAGAPVLLASSARGPRREPSRGREQRREDHGRGPPHPRRRRTHRNGSRRQPGQPRVRPRGSATGCRSLLAAFTDEDQTAGSTVHADRDRPVSRRPHVRRCSLDQQPSGPPLSTRTCATPLPTQGRGVRAT